MRTLLISVPFLLALGCDSQDPLPAPEEPAPTPAATSTNNTAPDASGQATPATPTPSVPTPTPAATTSGPPSDQRVAEFAGLRGEKPASWAWQPPQNQMRAANYVIPGGSGGNQAHLVIFRGIGGSLAANVDRWSGQFTPPVGEDGPIPGKEPVPQELDDANLEITYIEFEGDYRGMSGVPKKDQMGLFGVLDSPGGPLQIRLLGDRDTVLSHREDFLTFLKGLEVADQPESPEG